MPQTDGSVSVINADPSLPDAAIAPPWAHDAAGKAVPTHYEIDGTTLVQVVEHKGGNYSYGITADPHWGWVHIHRVWSATTARHWSRLFRDATSANGLAVALVGAATGGVGIVVAGAIGSFGFNWISTRISDANDDSHGRGVTLDIGLRCINIPFAPDPCSPALWIHPR